MNMMKYIVHVKKKDKIGRTIKEKMNCNLKI